jgi:threonyl-tRNA synthetase
VLHRHEASGALNGLIRVRRFQQDDSHIFCTLDQIENEVLEVLNFVDHTYKLFGMKYKVYVSTRPDKYIGDIDTWNKAEEIIKKCVQSSKSTKLNIKEGDGAFYGPKIDIALVDRKNRESQCGTIQLDFNLPASDRFNLLYKDSDQQMKHPIIIHRAVTSNIISLYFFILFNIF